MLLGLAALVGACAGGDGQATGWVALGSGQRTVDSTARSNLRIEPDGRAAWVDYQLAPQSWRAGDVEGTWVARRPDGMGFMKSDEELVLAADGVEYAKRLEVDNPTKLALLAAGEFVALGEQLHLCLPTGQRPGNLRFSVQKVRATGARPVLGGWTGEGFTLWPGEAISFPLRNGSGRTLSFYWAWEPLDTGSAEGGRPRLELLLGETTLASLSGTPGDQGSGRWCRVVLPAGIDDESKLRFEPRGAACLSIVLAPGVGPTAPEPARAPDLVLFLADTLRADSLSHAGGPAGLTPELDRLATQSLRFTTARSPSTWTLPAQASMLSGLYPEQHGAVSLGQALPDELVTLAEHLAQHGYRTGAVTDSAFVSRNYGLDQGFEWFQEFRTWDLQATLEAARAFLEADDGRPTFLFVQTYRTHMPYRTGADEDHGPLDTVVTAVRAGCERYGGDGSISPAEAAARLRGVYEQGVRALDAAFGVWWREVRARAPERTCLVFTSDHGEAFLEHGEVGHGGQPWEVKIRIPLLIQGPDIEPGTSAATASLVDLPATFCALAGIPPHRSWEGLDLLSSQEERASYSFVRIGEEPVVAVIEGTRKLFATADPEGLEAGELRGATDLAEDPLEESNQAEQQSWPAELARAHAAAVGRLLKTLGETRAVELSDEDRALLDAIGYGGE